MLKKYRSALWFQKRVIIGAVLLCLILIAQQAIYYLRIKSGAIVDVQTYEGLMKWFCVGIIAGTFGMTFRFLLGMGVSRRVAVLSNITIIILVSLILALGNVLILRFFIGQYDSILYIATENTYISEKIDAIQFSIYRHEISENGAFRGVIAEMFAWSFSMMMMFASIAYAVRAIVYRLSARGRKLFFALMAALVLLIPSSLYLLSRKTDAISKAISYLLLEEPLRSSVSFTVIAIIMFTTAYLLIRRAPLKYKEE